ncbi:hypothetical protein [Romboutsia lituseburensis]|uniref:Putative cell wall binding repeat-containing protein n=1 Tax=Romboutsia lituseburensis DSM 797 TaxID=1121325 RepID=A0A1G9PG89_9FIRM|nr:hypothetical protein [Romboutsia lituseburensis]CEH33374.1 Prokaryotic membrane lipoprotein lipid attachment site profile [Romboutsia lituseburensis]SDL97780.1 Putative cell wall binding repeat-containing protein [Romboutsia lituseburensis DSM 797]
MLLKSKCKSVLAITLISASCLMWLEETSIYAQENNTKGVILHRAFDPDSISLDSIISNVTIKNKDGIYELFKPVNASVEISNKDVDYIIVDGNKFTYDKYSKSFDGVITNTKPQKIVVHYTKVLKKTYIRNEANENTFRKFDIDTKKAELLNLDIEKKETLSVGDKVKVSAKLDIKNTNGSMPKRIGLKFANNNVSGGEYKICLTYNSDKGIYEGYLGYGLEPYYPKPYVPHYTESGAIPYEGNSKLIEVGVYENDFYERYTPVITDKEALQKYSFDAQKYENPIKNICYLGDKIKIEVKNGEDIKGISIESDCPGMEPEYDRYFIEKLDKKEGNVFEGNNRYLPFCKIIVYKSDGGYAIYTKEEYPNYEKALDCNQDKDKTYKWVLLDNYWYLYKISLGDVNWRLNYQMQTGWQNIEGQWYYMYANGKMAANTVIDGWKINSSGVATKIM